MTKINKIVMHGFKSFANRTELIFGSDFNCILGPNGSGKSNVLDALCFVLGKSSAKGLRAEKSSNLIYNGGKLKTPSKQAEVSLYLSNNSKIFPTDDKEVKITRIVTQTGQSKYKINDKMRTRQQIIDLLALARTGPESNNIILQGDIVRFVEMPTAERRKLIEEIAGISVYEEKKTRALNELGKVDEKLKEASIILTERKTHLHELKTDRDQALKYKDLNEKIKQNKASYLHLNITKKRKEQGDYERKIKEYAEKITEIQKRIDTYKKEIEHNKTEIKKINEEIEKKGEKEQVKLHKEIEDIRIAITTDKQRILACENEVARIKQRATQLQINYEELDKKLSNIEEEKKALLKSKQSKEQDQKTLNAKIAAFKQKHNLDKAGNVEQEIAEIDKKADEKQKEIQELREKQQEYLREKDKLEFQLQGIDETIIKVAQIEKENKSQIEALKQKREEFKKTTLEVNQLLSDDSNTAARIGAQRKKIAELHEEQAKLSARSASMMEGLQSDRALKAVMELRKNTPGIHGTIAELGNVEQKYSTSLEIAAGPKLKSIVVTDDSVAAKCIKFLKTNRLGTAIFIPLNKIKAKGEDEGIKTLIKAEGVHGKAIDLVTYDSKYKNAFSWVFGNTLVVDNIETARKVGIGSARMVTLDGDLAELSGAMQGGFRDRGTRSVGFQEKNAVKALQDIEKLIMESEGTLSVLEKARKTNEEKIERLRNLKANLEGDIIKTEKTLHLGAGDLDTSKKQKEELKTRIASHTKELSTIQEKVLKTNKDLASLKMKKQEMRDMITELRSPALLAELNTFEQRKEEIREGLTKMETELKTMEAQKTSVLAPEKQNIEKILKQLKKEEDDFKKEGANLKEKIKKDETGLKDKEELEKKFFSQFKAVLNQRTKLGEEIQKTEVKIIKDEEQARSAEQRSNLQSLERARVTAELAGLDQEFESFKEVKIFTNKNEDQIKKDIWECEKLIETMGAVNMRALEIYERVEKEYEELVGKEKKLNEERGDIMKMMEEIEGKKKDRFNETFITVNDHFQKIFQLISRKGEAELEIENPERPFDEGVRIKVRLSGNKFLDIRSLSGGEKTLTALAFIFAIQEHQPAPFYVLDEVDAALDKHNSEKLAKLIRQYAARAQYVIISHNDSLISESSNLYGVSMNEHGQSKVVSLKL